MIFAVRSQRLNTLLTPTLLKSNQCRLQKTNINYLINFGKGFVERIYWQSSSECRGRSDCTYVQADRDQHSLKKLMYTIANGKSGVKIEIFIRNSVSKYERK